MNSRYVVDVYRFIIKLWTKQEDKRDRKMMEMVMLRSFLEIKVTFRLKKCCVER